MCVMKTKLSCLVFILNFYFIHGQLSIDELFTFNSKYAFKGDCNQFQYNFSSISIHNENYNQLNFDCNSRSLILQSTKYIQSTICPEDEATSKNFRIHFRHLSFSTIEVNQLRLHGIELCSVDDLIQSIYTEFSYYRSTWGLLINLEYANKQHHVAIATNNEMTFVLFLNPFKSKDNSQLNEIEIIFPYENTFLFNQSSSMKIWRIDEGFVRIPKSQERNTSYQLSKTKFSLFNNETFFIYGLQPAYPKLLTVRIDRTEAKCTFNNILRCQFPLLPLTIDDSHEPVVRISYILTSIFNSTVSLILRQRLHQISTSQHLTNLDKFVVNIDKNLCK